MVALRSPVLVDEPAEQVMPQDRRTGPADLALVPVGTSQCEGSVRSMPVVVSEELGEHLVDVTVAAYEHAVQALAPKGTYDPLAYRVRIRRPHGRADDLDTFGRANTPSKLVVNLASRLRTKNRRPEKRSASSRARWVTHGPVGCAVTPPR